MKKTMFTFMSLLMCTFVFTSCGSKNAKKEINNEKSQTIDSTEIKLELKNKEFTKDSLELTKISSYSITKISGNHKYGGKTRIEYKSYIQCIEEQKIESEKEMSSKEDLQFELDMLKEDCIGGQLTLFIDRNTIGHANTEILYNYY